MSETWLNYQTEFIYLFQNSLIIHKKFNWARNSLLELQQCKVTEHGDNA